MLIMEHAQDVQLVVQLVLLLLFVQLVYRDTDYLVLHVLHVVLIVYNVLTQLVQTVQKVMPLSEEFVIHVQQQFMEEPLVVSHVQFRLG